MILDRFTARFLDIDQVSLIPQPGVVASVTGLPGAAPALLAAAIRREKGRCVVGIAPGPAAAEAMFADLEAIGAGSRCRYLPQRETLPFENADPHVEISSRRADAFASLLAGRADLIITTARGLMERSAVAANADFGVKLKAGDKASRDDLAARLERLGFESRSSAQELGDFVVRGGIIDVFPFGHDDPLRIEFWDDEIASLRQFDLLTQRSIGLLETAEVLPIVLDRSLADVGGTWECRCLLELLPDSSIVLELVGVDLQQSGTQLWREVSEAWGERPDDGSASEIAMEPSAADGRLQALSRIRIIDAGSGTPAAIDFGLDPHPVIERDMQRLLVVLTEAVEVGEHVTITCDNAGQIERLEEILQDVGGGRLARRVRLSLGAVSGGFRIPGPEPMLLLTDHEIFRRSHRLRRTRRLHGVASLESVASLRVGDYVVHLDHGVGRYAGLERVTVGGETVETLTIEYADGGLLRVPHYRLDMIERWSGVGDQEGTTSPPKVHKLGGRQWKALRQKTEASIRAMATELLQLYAHRAVQKGHSYSPETRWQRELESAFLYEDTPDQRAAWEQVREDMESSRIMDRLVCGDVGYGKTEVAVRAAFKAVQDGKQVAVLAPTTILVEQHVRTFRERLAAFPVRVESLSRLRSQAEQQATVEGLADGKVDIVIGTHRLLSGDIGFSDLGLLVVDEEQRFGVRHKERLKELRRSVDVLTLTATPIPRTLQLALGGMRDMSRIETAPRDRMPVITHVLDWNDGIIRDAMQREFDRGGIVFFVHDRIETIDVLIGRVERLAPGARIGIAHGQLPESELEEVMRQLLDNELDVLVSTSIIENGLDVPAANTMIVHRADRFGLAQLYQLRGRVGRSHHRAFCYLLLPPNPTPDAVQRLRILEHHTELGSGYRVALKDLQMRGAGNLLGADQTGFAQAVGFDTYQRLMTEVVDRLRGAPEKAVPVDVQVSIDGDAYLPDDYVAGEEQKMNLYRRLSKIDAADELNDLEDELRDRFGPLPDPVQRLLSAAKLKLLGGEIQVEWMRITDRSARLNFAPHATPRLRSLSDAFADRQITVDVRRTQPLSLALSQAGVEPLLPTLLEALERLSVVPAA
ncbi:MAG: transcription-repair coupling factor [Gemmatimonadales bacterium]|nr:MAG: transcription-repair coupling factor [Gemmatimonadales bacterium]